MNIIYPFIFLSALTNLALLVIVIWLEMCHSKERDILTKKIMSKSFIDYSNYELAKNKPKTEPKQVTKIRI